MKKQKNLVIITPDQLRADYLGCYGHPTIGTANIDALARDGIRLENCYCAAPLCGPSRISFATSTYFSEHNHRDYGATISPDVPNLVTSLHQAGYVTGMFGKNHLFTYRRLPELWDELDEICVGNYDGHPSYHHSFSGFTMEDDHPYNLTGRLTSETIDFIRRRQDRPFFAWVNYQDPHPAYTCPKPYDTMFDPGEIQLSPAYFCYDASRQPIRNEVWRRHSEMDQCTEEDLRNAIAHYMGQIRYVDDSVGRIMDCLRGCNLENDTIVLFFSDHGELLGDYNMCHKLPAFYDCLSRIPVILRIPGRNAGAAFKGLVEEVDLAPTLLELLGVPIPKTMVGTSLVEALEHENYDSFKETVLCEAGGGAPTCREPIPGLKLVAPRKPTSLGPGAMVRWKNWKLSVYADDQGELYDLEQDPHELHNLYDLPEYGQLQQELTLRLLQRVLSVKNRDHYPQEWEDPVYPHDVRFEPLEYTE